MKVFLFWYKCKMYTRILVPSFCIVFVIFKTCFSLKILADTNNETIVEVTDVTDISNISVTEVTDISNISVTDVSDILVTDASVSEISVTEVSDISVIEVSDISVTDSADNETDVLNDIGIGNETDIASVNEVGTGNETDVLNDIGIGNETDIASVNEVGTGNETDGLNDIGIGNETAIVDENEVGIESDTVDETAIVNETVETVPENTVVADVSQSQSGFNTKVFKKLSIPRGASLTLTAQVSKPKILPGFFFDEDGVILDAVIEIPIWLDIDRFVDAMYNQEEVTRAAGNNRHSSVGKERCFLYQQLEELIGSIGTVVSLPLGLPRACLLRTICEIQSTAQFYELRPQSLMIEMLGLILSPSFGSEDECSAIYLEAESMGKYGDCEAYVTKCPVDIVSIIMSQTFNSFV